MTHRLEDLNRRNLNLNISKVSEALPEYFSSDHSLLNTFLEKYYDFLDSSGAHSFNTEITNILSSRDITQTDNDYLDQLITEIGNGLTSSSFFENPRLMAKLLPLFYSSKGTKLSAEGFFRGFFGEEVEVSSPKDSLLYVGGINPTGLQGLIGPEEQFRIQDHRLYQIFSILLRSGLSKSDYEVLYKKFVHPAGFFFGTEVLTQGNGIITSVGSGENPIPPPLTSLALVVEQAISNIGTPAFHEITALVDSGDNLHRITLNDPIDRYDGFTVDELANIYPSLERLTTPNSFTLDIGGKFEDPQTIYTADSLGGYGFFTPPNGYEYVEDSAAATRQTRALNNSFILDPAFSGYFVGIRWYGAIAGQIYGFEKTGDSDGIVKTIDSGDLFYSDYLGINSVFRADYIYDIDEFGRAEWAVSKLKIDSDGLVSSDGGPDMSLITETMDNDMFTRYTSDSSI
jgi:hypothetical protein